MNNIFNIKTVGDLETFMKLLSETISYDDSGNSKSYVAKMLGFKSYDEAYRVIERRQSKQDISEQIDNIFEKMYDIDTNLYGEKINEFFINTFNLKISLDSIVETGVWHQDDAVDTLFLHAKIKGNDKLFILGTSTGMKAFNYIPENENVSLYSLICFNLNEEGDFDDLSKENMYLFRTKNSFTELKETVRCIVK